jgi:hypothetical protein
MFNARTFVRSVRANSRIALGSAVLALTLAATPAAHAQFGGRASFGEAFQPDILQRDMTLMLTTLQLEEWQRPILESLIEDYMTSFTTGVEGVKERMKTSADKARASGGTGAQGRDLILEAVMKDWEAWRTEKRQLFDKFVSNLQSQLGPQQRELWPKFERALRRERQLHEGELSGESVDLWSVLAQMQLGQSEMDKARTALDAYEIALDEALVNRMTRAEEFEAEMKSAMSEMNYDKGADIQDKIVALRVLVRTVNDEGIDKVAAALGERGADFRAAALKAGYAEAFRRHPVLILIDDALSKIDSLTPEQKAQIEAIRTELEAACVEANMRYYEMLRVEEPKIPRRKVEAQKARQQAGGSKAQGTPSGSNLKDPIVKARMEREAMGDPYRQRLMAILNPDQQPEIPGDKLNPKAERPKMSDVPTEPTQAQESIGSNKPAHDSRNPRPRRDPRNPAGGPRDGGNAPRTPPAQATPPANTTPPAPPAGG